jgi:NitT/TauT family transport system substrate-binding protein
MKPTLLGYIARFMAALALFLAIGGVIEATAAASPQAPEKIIYRLKWLFNASTAGDLYAEANGLFAKRGLEVTVKAGGPERDAIRELELGYAQFGVASADQVIRALAKGARVAVVAQLFQVNPLQWIYRPDRTTLRQPGDLRGKTIGITYGGNDETIMRTLLAAAGLTESDVSLFSVRYDYTPFFRRQVDLWPVYRNAQGPILSQKLANAGEAVAFFNPADFGVQFVANSVVTSSRLLDQRPEVVADFIAALLQGWRESLDPANRERTIAILQSNDRETARDILVEQLDITRRLIMPAAAVGAIDRAAWIQTEAIMLQQKQIDAPVHVENALKPQP